jgi:hypothetical protein
MAYLVIDAVESAQIKRYFRASALFFRVVFQPIAKYFTISSMCVENQNHPMSKEDISTYQKKK